MKKENLLNVILSVVVLSIITAGVIWFFVYEKRWIGFIFLILGILHLGALKLFGRKIVSVWPDIVFGAIDNGFLAVGALIGANFAGVIGAVVGGSAANAITDGLAGIFEGWTAESLRNHKIENKRTVLSSAVGKMAGCLFGAGVVLIIAWSILN